jgi:hypothetical protein
VYGTEVLPEHSTPTRTRYNSVTRMISMVIKASKADEIRSKAEIKK